MLGELGGVRETDEIDVDGAHWRSWKVFVERGGFVVGKEKWYAPETSGSDDNIDRRSV